MPKMGHFGFITLKIAELSRDSEKRSIGHFKYDQEIVPYPSKYLNEEVPLRVKYAQYADFRYFNKCMVRRPYPIPKIADVLQKLEGIHYVASLDLNMGY